MLDITTIKKSYSSRLHTFDRALLREYLQYQILSSIFSHKTSKKLSFLGGTALRIVHQLPRFSEDIDFDNKDLTESEFKELSEYLERALQKQGYEVEIIFIAKGAFHCNIKFPDLLYQYGISPQKREKILIQIDTFDQKVMYDSERFILDKFDFFTPILTTPKNVILSQKLWTITQRARLKGRDFFDIMFLLQTTQPDMQFLEAKFGQIDISEIVEIILGHLHDADYQKLAQDVRPFLFTPHEAEKITHFPEFLRQNLLHK